MKLICAGYPKTGSKSCSSALRELGYNVADYMETLEFLSTDWRNYIRGAATIEDVLKAYDREGFDTNQDLPGNLLWEDLYNASPKGTKVLLTVRDDDAQWWRSWCGFQAQEINRMSVFGISMNYFLVGLSRNGWMGPEFAAMYDIIIHCVSEFWNPDLMTPPFLTSTAIEKICSKENKLRSDYKKHILYVKHRVPKEDLLVWNVKDGYEPLCKFLGKSVPNKSVPHDNRTGDKEFIKKYALESKMYQDKFDLMLSKLTFVNF